jgi:hypothetical protein
MTASAVSAPVLAERQKLFAAGFAPGAPAHLQVAAKIDRRAYRSFRCARCNRRCTFEPYHKGLVYRALLVCPCGHCEEA